MLFLELKTIDRSVKSRASQVTIPTVNNNLIIAFARMDNYKTLDFR
jgi:hypothetical protein